MRTLLFLSGLVLGVFGLLILESRGIVHIAHPHAPAQPGLGGVIERPAREAPTGATEDDAAEEELAKGMLQALGDPRGGRGLEAIAVALEEALFEKDWSRVQMIATIIRKRGAAWTSAPNATPAAAPVVEASLFEQASDVRRKLEEERLANRRNRATALAGKTDRVSIDELLRILDSSEDEVERNDAAWLVAKSGDEIGIRSLVHDLHVDSAKIRAAAGLGLAREDVLAGVAEAASILSSDPSADLRRTAVFCLGQFDAVLHGNAEHAALRPFLDALAKDQSDLVRAEAARMLERCDIHGVHDLRLALYDVIEKDDSARARLAAVQSLIASTATFGLPDDAPDRIERAIRLEKAPEVQLLMIEFLERYGDDAAIRALDGLAPQPIAQQNAGRIAAARQAISVRLDSLRR